MIGACGGKVIGLHREAMGPIRLGDLPLGHTRSLTVDELKQLQGVLPPATRDATERRGAYVKGDMSCDDVTYPVLHTVSSLYGLVHLFL